MAEDGGEGAVEASGEAYLASGVEEGGEHEAGHAGAEAEGRGGGVGAVDGARVAVPAGVRRAGEVLGEDPRFDVAGDGGVEVEGDGGGEEGGEVLAEGAGAGEGPVDGDEGGRVGGVAADEEVAGEGVLVAEGLGRAVEGGEEGVAAGG